MQELTPDTITDAVLGQMATTSDPRMKEVMGAAVRDLHAFAKEVNLTPGEWIKGIEFMTSVRPLASSRPIAASAAATALALDFHGTVELAADA